MSELQKKDSSLADWIKTNPSFTLHLLTIILGGGILYGTYSAEQKANKEWQTEHLASHSVRAQENAGRFAQLETRGQQFDAIQHRLATLEGIVSAQAVRIDKLTESHGEIMSRLTRIETLIETLNGHIESLPKRRRTASTTRPED